MASDIWLSGNDEDSPEPLEEPASWRRWVPFAAVFVLGVVVALVVADARRDAAGSESIELLAGGSSLTDAASGGAAAESVDFYLFNTGPQEVDIVTVTADGFAVDTDAGEPMSVTAEPGEWVSFSTELVPDCAVRPNGDLDVVARGGAGKQTLHPKLAPGAFDTVVSYWSLSCRSLREVVLGVELERAEQGRELTTVLGITQSSTRPVLKVLELESRTPGVRLVGADDVLPITVRNQGPPVEIRLKWRVSQCESAMEMTDLSLEALVAGPQGGGERIRIDAATHLVVELARLSERVCET